MTAGVLEPTTSRRVIGYGERERAQSIVLAHRLRALAWVALRDGAPKAELRAANARSAARIVLRHAKQASVLGRMILGHEPTER